MGDQWRNYGNGYNPNQGYGGQEGGYYPPGQQQQMNPGASNFNPSTGSFVPQGGYGMPPQGQYPQQYNPNYQGHQYQMRPQQYGYQDRGGQGYQQGYYQQQQYQGGYNSQGGYRDGRGRARYQQRSGYQSGGRGQRQQQYQQPVQDSWEQQDAGQDYSQKQSQRGARSQMTVKKTEDKKDFEKPEIKTIDPSTIPGLQSDKPKGIKTIDPNSVPGLKPETPSSQENTTLPQQIPTPALTSTPSTDSVAQEFKETVKVSDSDQPLPEAKQTPVEPEAGSTPPPQPAQSSSSQAQPSKQSETASASASTSTPAASASPEDSAAAIEEEEKREKVRQKLLGEKLAKDARDHLNVVFIGHVDAGKSTLGGQILYLTGMVDQRTIEKYEKEAKDKNRDSWYMAYIMDTDESERSKGKTVEVGRAVFNTEKRRYTVLDAPGHKNYVPNMIAGASLADIGVLVIAARKGEFETGFERGGQTREHAQLAKTLGVQKLVVAINKMDDPSICKNAGVWDQGRYDEIQTGLTPFLKACGYKPEDTIWLPISALTGGNVKDPVDKSTCPWYNGQSLFGVLDSVETIPRDAKAPFRMPIMEKYKDMGAVVMGKGESGSIMKGDKLYVMPNRTPVSVANLFVDDDEVEVAGPGENLRMRLVGVEEEDISAGLVLSSRVRTVPCVKKFECQLVVMELLEHKSIFSAGYRCMLHLHSLCEECEIHAILYKVEKKGVQKKVKFVNSNSIIVCRIALDKQICCETFSVVPQLGRFTLRDEGRTIAMGKITKLPKDKSSA